MSRTANSCRGYNFMIPLGDITYAVGKLYRSLSLSQELSFLAHFKGWEDLYC